MTKASHAMSVPTISIVIPAYNAARYLPETIESVLAQTRTDWELVIVDDGSTDDTLAIAQRYKDVDARIRTVHQSNAGMAEARNGGFRQVDERSRYVIFLDADDMWEPDALDVLMAALATSPEAVAAHGMFRYMDAESRCEPGPPDERLAWGRPGMADGRLVAWGEAEPTTFEVLVVENCIVTPGQILLRRDALEKAGLFDSEADTAADWDLWLRVALLGNIAFVAKPVLRYRRHAGNASRRWRTMDHARRYVRQKLIQSSALSTEQRTTAMLGSRWARWELSRLRWRWARQNFTERRYYAATGHLRRAVIQRIRFHLDGANWVWRRRRA